MNNFLQKAAKRRGVLLSLFPLALFAGKIIE